MRFREIWLAALLLLLSTRLADARPPDAAARADVTITTVEGEVVEIFELPGEGDLPLVAVKLAREGERQPFSVLLAPQQALEEIGFVVEIGDRLKVRIFADGDSPARGQRVLNVSRSRMVQLRTLRHAPLWSASGAWQGAGSRGRPGLGPGGRTEGGSPGPGAGPGPGPGSGSGRGA